MSSVNAVCRKKKEHEAEQHLFGDKEAFVTGAYKRYQADQAKYAADLNERCVTMQEVHTIIYA